MKFTVETTIQTDREPVLADEHRREQHDLWNVPFTEIEYPP